MRERYGVEVIAELEALRTSSQKVSDGDLRALFDQCQMIE